VNVTVASWAFSLAVTRRIRPAIRIDRLSLRSASIVQHMREHLVRHRRPLDRLVEPFDADGTALFTRRRDTS
jgi:hypothetical protein